MKDKVKRLMITIKNIKNVEYDDEKEPKSFELMIDCSEDVDREDEEHKQLRLIYTKMKSTDRTIIWKVETDIIDFTPSATVHHYKTLYGIPSKRVSLVTTAGMGLYNLQNAIKSEIQYKTMLDFNIGELLSGMV
jgi:hypothetical protein